MIINLRKNFFLFHKLKFFLKNLNIFSNKNQKDNKKRINNLKKRKQVDQKIFEDAIQAYDLKDFKGANSLITSGGSPLRIEVRIFFSCSVQGMDIVLKSKLKFLLKRAAGS